tara:strand:- start:1330 stop:1515 length:186 start_codon:yes stop_codon:yes gene_type:complete
MKSQHDMPLLVDSKEACKILFGNTNRKNYYRLYGMIEREEIVGTKIGERWFIPGKEIKKFM